jgi:hypothetical protein
MATESLAEPCLPVAVPGLIRTGTDFACNRQKDGTARILTDGIFVFTVSSMEQANQFVHRELDRLVRGVYRADPRFPASPYSESD